MRRREFIIFLVGSATAGSFAALAQEPGRTYRLGFLYPGPLEPPHAVAAFFGALREHGFIEGKNLTIGDFAVAFVSEWPPSSDGFLTGRYAFLRADNGVWAVKVPPPNWRCRYA